MKQKFVFIPDLILCGVFLILAAGIKTHASGSNRIYAGTAKVDYTPSSIPDSMIHDHQFIRVIAFSDGEKRALLVATETKWIHNDLWKTLTDRILKETGIPGEYVMITAVHTHSGAPLGDDFNDKVMDCINEALTKLEPVRIGAGKGICRYNMNRRARAPGGGIWLGRNPDGPCDHELGVLRVDNEKGDPISIMVNWPCHAVINFPQPKLYSGDWPGEAARFVEKYYHQSITVPISIGASGDINPLYYESESPFEFDKHIIDANQVTGMFVGEEAVRVADEITTYPTCKIKASQRLLSLPGKKPFPTRMPDQVIEQGDNVNICLTTLKIGNIVLVGIGGELMTEIGMNLKDQSPYKNTFILTHCNGSCGYLITDKALQEGGLEAIRMRGMPGTEKILVENILEMINGL